MNSSITGPGSLKAKPLRQRSISVVLLLESEITVMFNQHFTLIPSQMSFSTRKS